jgi:hypothetical protein
VIQNSLAFLSSSLGERWGGPTRAALFIWGAWWLARMSFDISPYGRDTRATPAGSMLRAKEVSMSEKPTRGGSR